MNIDNSYLDDEYISRINQILEVNPNSELKKLVGLLIEERHNYREMSLKDELTKVYNRRILQNDDMMYGVVVMCDVDKFKDINDEHGHYIGDEILIFISNEIEKNIGDNDIVCRYGGDEFTIIFRDFDIKNAINRMEEIKKSIRDSKNFHSIQVTISFGVSKYEYGKTLKNAIDEADRALYKSKENGRNRGTLYKSKCKVRKR